MTPPTSPRPETPAVSNPVLSLVFKRSVRESTQQQTKQSSQNQTPPRRIIARPGDTASLERTPGHKCHDFNPDKTRIKIDARIAATFDRFFIAHTWQCKTSRGTTGINGTQAHCQSRCQAAHASLAPKLKDDYLEIVANQIKDNGFDEAPSEMVEYFMHRFGLTEATRIELQGDLSDSAFVDYLLEQLHPNQKKGSFIDTDKELQRNSTIEQSQGANRIDCSVEATMRKIEETLAAQCTSHESTPQKAMEKFLQDHAETTAMLIRNIQSRKEQFEEFLALHEKMQGSIEALKALTPETTPEETYREFLAVVQQYLSLKKVLKDKPRGFPSLTKFLNFSLGSQMDYLLKQLVKKPEPVNEAILHFHTLKDQLNPSPPDEDDVSALRADIRVRLMEATTQHEKILAILEDIPSFEKLYYGVSDAPGQRTTPSKENIHRQLISLSHSLDLASSSDEERPPLKRKPIESQDD